MKTISSLLALLTLAACQGFDTEARRAQRKSMDQFWAQQRAEDEARREENRLRAIEEARQQEWTRVGGTYGPAPTQDVIDTALDSIKAGLKNPPSFEFVSVTPPQRVEFQRRLFLNYDGQADTWTASYYVGWGYIVTYRATNGYGGVVTGYEGFINCPVLDDRGYRQYGVDAGDLALALRRQADAPVSPPRN